MVLDEHIVMVVDACAVVVEPVAAFEHAPSVATKVVGEPDPGRDILCWRLREPRVRTADSGQDRDDEAIAGEVPVLIVEITVDVVPHPQVQGQPRPHAPIVLDVGLHLRGALKRVHVVFQVGSRAPLLHGPRSLKPLRI